MSCIHFNIQNDKNLPIQIKRKEAYLLSLLFLGVTSCALLYKCHSNMSWDGRSISTAWSRLSITNKACAFVGAGCIVLILGVGGFCLYREFRRDITTMSSQTEEVSWVRDDGSVKTGRVGIQEESRSFKYPLANYFFGSYYSRRGGTLV